MWLWWWWWLLIRWSSLELIRDISLHLIPIQVRHVLAVAIKQGFLRIPTRAAVRILTSAFRSSLALMLSHTVMVGYNGAYGIRGYRRAPCR